MSALTPESYKLYNHSSDSIVSSMEASIYNFDSWVETKNYPLE